MCFLRSWMKGNTHGAPSPFPSKVRAKQNTTQSNFRIRAVNILWLPHAYWYWQCRTHLVTMSNVIPCKDIQIKLHPVLRASIRIVLPNLWLYVVIWYDFFRESGILDGLILGINAGKYCYIRGAHTLIYITYRSIVTHWNVTTLPPRLRIRCVTPWLWSPTTTTFRECIAAKVLRRTFAEAMVMFVNLYKKTADRYIANTICVSPLVYVKNKIMIKGIAKLNVINCDLQG